MRRRPPLTRRRRSQIGLDAAAGAAVADALRGRELRALAIGRVSALLPPLAFPFLLTRERGRSNALGDEVTARLRAEWAKLGEWKPEGSDIARWTGLAL